MERNKVYMTLKKTLLVIYNIYSDLCVAFVTLCIAVVLFGYGSITVPGYFQYPIKAEQPVVKK